MVTLGFEVGTLLIVNLYADHAAVEDSVMSILFHAWPSIPHIKAVYLKQGRKLVGRIT